MDVETTIQQLQETSETATTLELMGDTIPEDSARMALLFTVLGPIMIVYPFFQKYFVKGLTLGAVKG